MSHVLQNSAMLSPIYANWSNWLGNVELLPPLTVRQKG